MMRLRVARYVICSEKIMLLKQNSAPGLALQTLLREAKTEGLKKLIGQSTIDVLEGLDPELTKDEKLGEIAAELIVPSEALRNPTTRDQIINLLPLSKARELAERLEVKESMQLFFDLRQAASDKTALSILFSFFGVVHDTSAPLDTPADAIRLSPCYGLFDYQRVAANKVCYALYESPRKVVLHMPTGSGKTRTAMHIVADHLKTHEPTLVCWLAQNAELLDQATDEFEKAWSYLGNREVDVLRFWGNKNADPLSATDGFIVAGLGKMYAFDDRNPASMLRLADRTSLVVIDEAHQAIAPTYASILSALYTKRPNTALLGLTATPGRTWSDITEDQKLSDFFDNQKVMLEVEGYADPVTFLIDEGYLAKPKFRTLNSQSGLALTEKDLHELSISVDVPQGILEKLGNDTTRNLKIISEIEFMTNRHSRIIVFAPSVENARLLAALLMMRGYEADVVTAQTRTTDRDRIIKRFRSDNPQPLILCNYGVLTTGFDAPDISAAMIARPTRSLVLYSQMVGRATRGLKAGGNAEAEIVTVIDPDLPGFGSIADAFKNWEDVWHEPIRNNSSS